MFRSLFQKVKRRFKQCVFLMFGFICLILLNLYIGLSISLASNEALISIDSSPIAHQPLDDQTQVDPSTRRAIQQAALLEVSNYEELHKPDHEPFVVETIRRDGNWALFNMASYPSPHTLSGDEHLVTPDLLLGIAQMHMLGIWVVKLENQDEFYDLLPAIPNSILSASSKAVLTSLRIDNDEEATLTPYHVPGLPYPVGEAWRYNQGPHQSWETNSSLDFGTPTRGVSARVHAAEAGMVINTPNSTCLGVKRGGDGLIIWYQHINPGDIDNFHIGDSISFGQAIGMTIVQPGCKGDTDGHHVHVTWQPNRDQSISPEGSSFNGWIVVGNQLHKNGVIVNPNRTDTVLHSGLGSTCPAPTLRDPADGHIQRDGRTITFRWNPLSNCQFQDYTFRICTSPDVGNLNNCNGSGLEDTGVGGTEYTYTVEGHDNQDLYWGVRAANFGSTDPPWAVRHFRVEPNSGSCNHNSNQVAFRTGTGFGGDCVIRGIGDYPNSGAIGLPDNSIKSIKVGENVQVQLCVDPNYGGTCNIFEADNGDLNGSGVGYGTSSAKVEARPNDTERPVVNWLEPVSNRETYIAYGETVQLKVEASDNVGVVKVVFDRWDEATQQRVILGDDTSPPYELELDTATLPSGPNIVNAKAVDAVNLEYETYIWIDLQSQVLDAPVLSTIDNGDQDGNYTVSWSSVPGAESYILGEGNIALGEYYWVMTHDAGSQTFYNITDRPPLDNEYCYRVRASNSTSLGPWSNIKCTTVSSGLVAPEMDIIQNADRDYNFPVSWSAVSGATYYELQQDESEDEWLTIYSDSDTQFNVTAPDWGFWCYRVRAWNAAGSSEWSNEECAIVDSDDPPQIPILYPINNPGQVNEFIVEWSQVDTFFFELQEQFENEAWETVYYDAFPSAVINVQETGEWCYRVRAGTGPGSGEWSNIECTVYASSLAAPSNLSATVLSCTEIALQWDPVIDGEGYTVYRDGLEIGGAFLSSYVDDTVNSNSTYIYFVRAYDENGDPSGPSNTVEVTTLDCNADDIESPTINWVEPVGNEGTYYVQGEMVRLRVEASDNVGVTRVRFRRWDHPTQEWLILGDAFGDPYQIDFDTSVLTNDANYMEMEATAYDAADNTSSAYIYLYYEPDNPGMPYKMAIPLVMR